MQNILSYHMLKKGYISGLAQINSISTDVIFGVPIFGFNYLRQFWINFRNCCANLAANFLNFLFQFAWFWRKLLAYLIFTYSKSQEIPENPLRKVSVLLILFCRLSANTQYRICCLNFGALYILCIVHITELLDSLDRLQL